MKRHLWVLEFKEDGEWLPSQWYLSTSRKEARYMAKEKSIAANKPRIVKYVPQEKAK